MVKYTLLKESGRTRELSELCEFVFTHCEPQPGDMVQVDAELSYTVKCRYWDADGNLFLIVHQPPRAGSIVLC